MQGLTIRSKSEQHDNAATSLGGRHPMCLLTPPQAQVSLEPSLPATPRQSHILLFASLQRCSVAATALHV
jgi:hypothetical protein